MNVRKAFVLLSGGVDSSTLIYRAAKEYDQVVAVSINYGQKHTKELEYAAKIQSGIVNCSDHIILNIQDVIGKGGLSDEKMVVPNMSYDDIKGVSPTYVPFRNGLMLSLLTSLAHADLEKQQAEEGIPDPELTYGVYYGAHAEDAANWAYPDCTPEFIGAMANAIYIGTYHKVRLHTPYMWYKKSEIIMEGWKLRVPYEDTWSCYKGHELHCGVCPTCLARKEAFRQAGIEDPTVYEVDV